MRDKDCKTFVIVSTDIVSDVLMLDFNAVLAPSKRNKIQACWYLPDMYFIKPFVSITDYLAEVTPCNKRAYLYTGYANSSYVLSKKDKQNTFKFLSTFSGDD